MSPSTSPSKSKDSIRWIHSLKEFNEWMDEVEKSLPEIKYELVFDDISSTLRGTTNDN